MRASKSEAGSDRPSAEDPLVELARIVHRNKQSGANVSSGRVGSTDYFAGLEDVADEPPAPARPGSGRVEPTFNSLRAVRDDAGLETKSAPAAPEVSVSAPVRPAATPSYDAPASHVSSLWPSAPETERSSDAPQAYSEPAQASDQVLPFRSSLAGAAQPDPVAANDRSYLAPAVTLDLEQSLTAELEDELIGALRQSVDETQPASSHSQFDEDHANWTEPQWDAPNRNEQTFEAPVAEPPLTAATSSYFRERIEERPVPATPPAAEPVFRQSPAPTPAVDRSDSYSLRQAATGDVEPRDYSDEAAADDALFSDEEPYRQPVPSQRPRIDENDFLAALNPVPADPAPKAPIVTPHAGHHPEPAGDPAGIDALFADLDFPDPVERRSHAAVVQPPVPDEPEVDDPIDDMVWPAAAASVPQTEDDETPPPPEGYDLDAVARAMQESDPSLTGAGVLPPHSAAERSAVPHSREKSRRGLYVAAGVLGVAVIGSAAFFFADGDAVSVPSGPPPVIAGLEQPLKIYPEQGQTAADDQQSKVFYDKINGNGAEGPERLVGTESPKPAELPPAPAGATGGAELVPGATKRVRTVLVRPDGSIIPSGDQPAAAAPATIAPAQPQATEPAAPAEEPRTVTTSPVVPDAVAEEPVVAEEPALADPQAPAIVTGADVAPEPTVSEPAAPIVTVTPRKKPDAPVQVASAAPAVTAPATAPAAQNDGPLNLNQQASAPAPAAPAAAAPAPSTSGSIPSGTYIVQVTSQRSEAAASEAYTALQRRFPAVLGNRNAVIVAATVEDRGVFYRARIPTTTRDDAINLCESLQAAGGDCFVRRQP
ncbi:SPOR domain-containing protein [Roseibium sp. M-1]